MSLNFDLSKIDRDTRSYVGEDGERYLKPLTEVIIWSTLSVGIGSISEKNIHIWMERLGALADIGEFILQQRNTETGELSKRQPTEEEIRSHIGLWTNVTTISKRDFNARLKRIKKEATCR